MILMKKILKNIKFKYLFIIVLLFLLSTAYAAISVKERVKGTTKIKGNIKEVTLTGNNITFSSNTVQIAVGGEAAFSITPDTGYYLKTATCTNSYTLTVETGVEQYDTQNVVVRNDSSLSNSTCTFTTERITASMLTYYKTGTSCTTAQCALDELFGLYS